MQYGTAIIGADYGYIWLLRRRTKFDDVIEQKFKSKLKMATFKQYGHRDS